MASLFGIHVVNAADAREILVLRPDHAALDVRPRAEVVRIRNGCSFVSEGQAGEEGGCKSD
jgi:hypothetical protein